ncbi:hypothetical protein [Pseudonocardia zijingensis]|uniref:hypothetical protein n=2 Tax=Pseudonocardia zijingensis TaxID=153376 RepID=UPI0036101BF9
MAPHRRRRAGAGAHRSIPTPLRRGAAAVAVTGSAFSLVGGASAPEPETRPQAAVVPVAQASPDDGDDSIADSVTGAVASGVLPVDPEPEIADAAGLVKAAQLAEQEVARAEAERAAAEAQAAEAKAAAERAAAEAARGPVDCGLGTRGLGPVKSNVRTAAEQLGCTFGRPTMHGVAGRAGTSDHPGGLAVDFMVDRSTGDALAECALANMDTLGVKYVIWRQRINHGNGWKRMEDRGGVTANHFDHVHISFDRGAGGGRLDSC